MRIGIDVSQLAYQETGVASYLKSLIEALLKFDKENEYVLFFSSMRRKFPISNFTLGLSSGRRQFPIRNNVKIKSFKFPPFLLDLIWNKLHILPIEWLIGDVDIFISSDWTQPPTAKAKKATILYDLIIYKHPEETDKKIIDVQKRKLSWVKKECDVVFCISESTKKDTQEILGIDENKLKVIYPGV